MKPFPHMRFPHEWIAYDEDIYNPARDAARVIGEWIKAGGVMATAPQVEMKYIVRQSG